jgi:perosamine synthetase
VAFQKFPSQVEPVVWATGLQLIGASVETRDKVLDLMLEAGIECRPGFYPASEQPIYGIQPVGNSERIASQIIVPPIDATLTEPLLDYICETLVECLAKAGHK